MRRVLTVVAVGVALGVGYSVGNVAPLGAAEAAASTEAVTRLLPACPGNHPDSGGDDLCGIATNSCPDPATLTTVWSRDAEGWSALDTVCLS
jgi:hypothetical protein